MRNLILLLSMTFYQVSVTAETPTAEQTIEFYQPANKIKPVGVVKLQEYKDHVLAVFEGTGLKKGKYKIVKLENCVVGTNIKSKASELLNFETNYGEISTDKKLVEPKIVELELDRFQLGLLKIEKNKAAVLSCGALQSTQ